MDEIHSLSLWIKLNLLRSASLWCFHSAVQRDPNLRICEVSKNGIYRAV